MAAKMEVTVEKEIFCIVCPKGCKITARLISEEAGEDIEKAGVQPGSAGQKVKRPEDTDIYEISGHSCTRGYEYAISECTNPVRTLTTTVRLLCADARIPALVPVKSSAPLPKSILKECMKVVNSTVAKLPIMIGEIIILDILGTGVDIIATANITGGSING